MRKLVVLVAAASMLMPAAPAGSAHFCGADTGTLVTVPLPPNPVDPARTHLYIHDRAATPGTGLTGNPLDPGDDVEGTYVYLENGKRQGYNPGGPPLVILLDATGEPGDPCGTVPCPDGLSACPKAGSDDRIF